MKRTLTSAGCLLLCASLLGINGVKGEASTPPQSPSAPAHAKRPTSESIINIRKQRDKENERQETSKPQILLEKSKDSNSAKGKSIRRSTFLGSGNNWARIPAGSLMHIPTRLKQKIISKPQGKIMRWGDFYKKNHGWIHLHSVSLQQARGLEAIKPDVIKAYQSMGKLVVAAYHGAPISVIPIISTPEQVTKTK